LRYRRRAVRKSKKESLTGPNFPSIDPLTEIFLTSALHIRDDQLELPSGAKAVDQSIRQLTISACNKLDFRSVAKLQALELVTIMSCRQEIRLADFNGLGRLRYLALTTCKLDTADPALLNPGGLKFAKFSILLARADAKQSPRISPRMKYK
jgi:hypothetical protein